MLEVLWKADNSREDTKYKVLFPITTPLMARPPHYQDSKAYYDLLIHASGVEMCNPAILFPATVLEDRVFSVVLGNFLHDVELKNINFSTGLLTVQECNARGYTVQEHSFPNGTKCFFLHVPFDADVVLKRVYKLTLHLQICICGNWCLCRILRC